MLPLHSELVIPKLSSVRGTISLPQNMWSFKCTKFFKIPDLSKNFQVPESSEIFKHQKLLSFIRGIISNTKYCLSMCDLNRAQKIVCKLNKISHHQLQRLWTLYTSNEVQAGLNILLIMRQYHNNKRNKIYIVKQDRL